MDMLPEDKKVVDLLSKLKSSNGAYPADMLSARRNQYLRQVANVGLGLGVGAGIKHSIKSGGNGAGGVAVVTSKVLETVLIAAIAIESGMAAYIYRNQILNAIRSLTGGPSVQQVALPSEVQPGSGSPVVEASSTALASATSITETTTATGSPIPGVTAGNAGGSNNGSGSNVTTNSTPAAGGNQGNQYGLTPKPERTKDPNSGSTNDGSNNGGGNNGGGNNGGGSNGGGNSTNNGGGNNKP